MWWCILSGVMYPSCRKWHDCHLLLSPWSFFQHSVRRQAFKQHGTVTLSNNRGAHAMGVMKYIPFKTLKHRTVRASSTPPRITFETESRNEVWFMKSHASHLRRKRDSCSAHSFKETSSRVGRLKISLLKSLEDRKITLLPASGVK